MGSLSTTQERGKIPKVTLDTSKLGGCCHQGRKADAGKPRGKLALRSNHKIGKSLLSPKRKEREAR